MSFKDVIVYVDGTDASKARDGLAINLAKTQGAHLVAVAFAAMFLFPWLSVAASLWLLALSSIVFDLGIQSTLIAQVGNRRSPPVRGTFQRDTFSAGIAIQTPFAFRELLQDTPFNCKYKSYFLICNNVSGVFSAA